MVDKHFIAPLNLKIICRTQDPYGILFLIIPSYPPR